MAELAAAELAAMLPSIGRGGLVPGGESEREGPGGRGARVQGGVGAERSGWAATLKLSKNSLQPGRCSGEPPYQ